jgi:hypothetical protein
MVIGTDKSDPQLKISAQNIKSSSDLSGGLFCCPCIRPLGMSGEAQSSTGKIFS